MSLYSFANIHSLDGTLPDIEKLRPDIEKFLDEYGIHHDVILDLKECFSGREGVFKVHSAFLLMLFEFIAKQSPSVSFGVQGRGDELRDVWVREYSGGAVSFKAGPFNE